MAPQLMTAIRRHKGLDFRSAGTVADQRPMGARWRVEDDKDAINLRVDLWNGHGLTLTVWKDGTAPFVALRSGGDEADLADATGTSFRRWIDAAQGRR